MGDLGSGNGSPGSLQGPEDSSGNTVPDYEPGNGQIVNDTSSGTSTGTGNSKGNNGVGNGDGGGKENNRGNGGKDKVSVLSVYTEPTTDLPATTDDSASGASELDSLLTTTDEEPTADITTDLVKENPFRYAGYYWDRKTQYYYLQARYYDPRPARFISEDTYEGEIENPQSLNQYVYAENNPLNLFDPTGHSVTYDAGGVAGGSTKSSSQWDKLVSHLSPLLVGAGLYLYSEQKTSKAVADYLFVDDINTLLNPNSSRFDKGLAAAGFVPFGKIVRGGKLVIKLVNKSGRIIERAVNLTQTTLNAAKGLKGSVKAISIADKKMYQLGDHFEKHGRSMGYASKKDYDAAAKKFALEHQGNTSATIVQGTWNGSGTMNGALQRAITYKGKTVVIDVNSGQIIDFYIGTEYKRDTRCKTAITIMLEVLMEKDLIVAGERIGGFYLGSSRKEILEQIKDQYTLIKLPYHQIIEFNCYKIWIHESDDIVTQILVHGGFEGKFLKEIGIGSSLSLLDEMGLKYEKGDYVYYIPSIPGISFELSDEEDWNELTSPIESISIFLPKYVSVG